MCEACGTEHVEVCWSDPLGLWLCLDCYVRLTPKRAPGPALALSAYEEGRRRREDRKRAALVLDEVAACERIAREAVAAGRRAVVDPLLAVVVTECSRCGPLDHLPLRVIPRWDALVFRCSRCGHERVDDRR